jgi:hypothetical protein
MMGVGGNGNNPPPPEVPPPNAENPTPVPQLTPFPLSGARVPHKGYLYTTPSDLDFLVFRQMIDDTNGWTLRYEQNEMYSWDRQLAGEPMRLIKAFGVFEGVAPELAYDLLHDPEFRIDWDVNRLDGFCIVHLTERTDIGYYAAKVSKPVSNRDFVNMRSWREVGNGEFIIMSTSVPHADVPPKDGIVRAHVRVSGYLVRKYGTGCSLTYVSHSDPKGWVPSYFINQLTCKLAPNVISSMRNAAGKYPAWIAGKGEAYQRPWKVAETPWPMEVRDATHEWVIDRRLKGPNASPPVMEQVASPAASEEAPPEWESPK